MNSKKYKIVMEHMCGCFKRNNFLETEYESTKVGALNLARKKCEKMNMKFCGKHNFYVDEDEDQDTIIIKVKVVN